VNQIVLLDALERILSMHALREPAVGPHGKFGRSLREGRCQKSGSMASIRCRAWLFAEIPREPNAIDEALRPVM